MRSGQPKPYYNNENLQLSIKFNLPAPSRNFPHLLLTFYGSEQVQFWYVGFLKDGFDCARTCADQDIVVKFTTAGAHRLLADNWLAPNVFYCRSPRLNASDGQPVYHSFIMMVVIVDYIDGDTLDNG